MCVACFGAAGVGGKPKLSDAVGDGSVGNFASKVFVARAPGFGGSSEEGVVFLCRHLRAGEF